MKIIKFWSGSILTFFLLSCGQQGPLYLPGEKPPIYVPPEERIYVPPAKNKQTQTKKQE